MTPERSYARPHDDVVADIEAGNFGDASDGTAAISEAYDELASAVDELGEEQREVLAPDVENLRAEIEAMPEAQGLDQLGSSIEAILTAVQNIYDEATDALRCE